MKGCISYEIVRLMGEGMHPQKACETAVARLDAELKERRGEAGDLSLIAMNKGGVGRSHQHRGIFLCRCHRGHGTNRVSGDPPGERPLYLRKGIG